MSADWQDYCRTKARAGDIDAYLAALFARPDVRADLWGVQAFAVELAHIGAVVHEPVIGEIRLQWWRDALMQIAEGRGDPHPVVAAMGDILTRHGLSRARAERMIDAHAVDLYERPFETCAALNDYAQATAGGLLMLQSTVLAPETPPDALARLIAEAAPVITLLRQLRRLRPQSARRRLFVPLELMAQTDRGVEAAFSGRNSPALASALKLLMADARAHLAQARAAFAALRMPALRPVFLPLALAQAKLDRLQAQGGDPFAGPLEAPVYRRQLTLLAAQLRGRL